MEISAAFFNNLSPDIREFLISEGVQVPPRPPTENNHQEKQKVLLVKNAALKAENNIRKINVAVKLESGRRHPRKFMGMLGGNPLIQMDGFCGSFQSGENKSMVAESME